MNKTIYALGFFDGVHVGHAALLSACREAAARYGWDAGVVTFDSHPDTLVLGSTPGLINTPYDREKLLRERFAMDTVVALPFDEQMRAMPWQDFLTMLTREYAAAGFVCGEDFRFGYKGAGNAALLTQYCADAGLPSAVVPEQTIDGVRVSSTYSPRPSAGPPSGHPHRQPPPARRSGGAEIRRLRLPCHRGRAGLSRRDQHRHPTHGGGP